jgi:hypothetical protein
MAGFYNSFNQKARYLQNGSPLLTLSEVPSPLISAGAGRKLHPNTFAYLSPFHTFAA